MYTSLFDGPQFKEELHIVGVGGIGSHLARLAGKERFPTVHLWDGDVVESKNMDNQWFDDSAEVGQMKTHAVARKLQRWTTAVSHPEMVDGRRPFAGVVCICTDSMESRKTICESSVWGNPDVALLVEARMDAEYVLIQVVDPHDEKHVTIWNRNWYPHEETENRTAGCGGEATAVAVTASMAANLMLMQVIRYAAIRQGYADRLDNFIELFFRPLRVVCKRW